MTNTEKQLDVLWPAYACLGGWVPQGLSLVACSGYDADYHHYMDKAQHAAWGRSDGKEHFPWGDEDFFQVHPSRGLVHPGMQQGL